MSLLYALTLQTAQVLEGYGRMMVTAVGLNSAQGQILGSISGAAPSAPGDGLRCAVPLGVFGLNTAGGGSESRGCQSMFNVGRRVPMWQPSHLWRLA